MDNQNLRDLKVMQPANAAAKLSLLLNHVAGRAVEDVADPYYGNTDGFDRTWAEVTEAARIIRLLLETG